MKKIILNSIVLLISTFVLAQDIEEVEMTSDEGDGFIPTAENMYSAQTYKKLVYDNSIRDLLFINDDKGALTAYSNESYKRWRFKPKDTVRLHNGRNKFYYKDGVIFTAYLTGYIYALDAKDGSVFWKGKIGLGQGKLRLRGQILKPYDNKLYITSENGLIYVINASNGELIWNYKLAYNYNHIPNLVHNGVVYIPNAPYVYSLESKTGKALYQRGFKKAMYGKPVVAGEHIVIANDSRTIFSLAPNNLDINWEFQLDEDDYKVGDKIKTEDKAIYLGTYSKKDKASVYKINAMDGTKVWVAKIQGKRVAYISIHDNAIYGYTENGNIFKIDKISGKIEKTLPLKNKPISNFHYKDKTIFYYTKAGFVSFDIQKEKEDILISGNNDDAKSSSSSQIHVLK